MEANLRANAASSQCFFARYVGKHRQDKDSIRYTFRAHEVPCDIQYQLSCPVDDSLMGIDYLEARISELGSDVGMPAERSTDWSFA